MSRDPGRGSRLRGLSPVGVRGIGLIALALLSAFASALALGASQPAGEHQAGACTAAGTWVHNTTGIGSTTWTIAADGTATEVGIGNATGRAALSGQDLTISFTASDNVTTGDYLWTLDSTCRSGSGSLTITGPLSRKGEFHTSTVTKTADPPALQFCAVPPRLRTAAQTTRSCNYRVAFEVRQVREPIRNLSRIVTAVNGSFLISQNTPGLGAKVCTTFNVAVTMRHIHVDPDDDDTVIRAKDKDKAEACLRRQPVTRAPTTMWVEVPIEVTRSNSPRCRAGSDGMLIARAGEPFPVLIVNICNHREVFSPTRPGKPRTSAVTVGVTVR